MERVKALVDKLYQQVADNAPANDLLVTVSMIQSELQSLNTEAAEASSDKVFVMLPQKPLVIAEQKIVEKEVVKEETKQEPIPEPDPIEIEEKVIEVLQVNEKEIEEELNEIKKNAEAVNKRTVHTPPIIEFDPLEEVPTLTHQATLNFEEPPADQSLNEKLKKEKKEVADKLTDTPIKDLKKAIGINDRYLFINELFRGDDAMYERSIKTINNFTIYGEAEFWIRRELKTKLGWIDDEPAVKQFDQLIRRRFS